MEKFLNDEKAIFSVIDFIESYNLLFNIEG